MGPHKYEITASGPRWQDAARRLLRGRRTGSPPRNELPAGADLTMSMDDAYGIAGGGPAGDWIAPAPDEGHRRGGDLRAAMVNSADTDPSVAFRRRMAQIARELQAGALEHAALLERRARAAGQPPPLDYHAQVKRWRFFAEQAEEMVRHWERTP